MGDCRKVITKAVDYLHRAQTFEGGWVGSWGICFTYAAQFACESLSLVGETYENSPYLRKACDFLLSHQRADGGWGESYKVRLLMSYLYAVADDRGSHARQASGWSTSRHRSCRPVGRPWRSSTHVIRTWSLLNARFASSCPDRILYVD